MTKKRIRKTKSEGRYAHKKTIINDIKFDSIMESHYYKYLLNLKEKGIVKEIELQPEFILQEAFIIVNGQVIYESDENFSKFKRRYKSKTIRKIKYVSDFKVTYYDGRVDIVDVKGQATTEFKLKRKMFLCKYPTLTLKTLIEVKGQWIDYDEYIKEKKSKKRKKTKEE